MTARFQVGSATHVGQVRSSNQDSCLPSPGEQTDDLFIVADGMGGHNGGEVASRLAIDTVVEQFVVPTADALVDAVQAANDALIAKADEDESLRGMGTTLVALAVVVTDGEERLAVANVGDSRCYLLERDRLRQVTKDHSVVQTLVDNGQITKAEAEHHPQRNILTRALGIDARVMTDSWELLPFAGDRYVLCSDGLFNEVSESDIADVLRQQPDPAAAANAMVEMANAGGGRDNISVVVVDVVEDGGRHAQASEALSRVTAHTSGGHRAVTTAVPVAPRADPDDGGTPSAGAGGAGGGSEDGDGAIERKGPSFRLVAFVSALIAVAVVVIGSVFFASKAAYYVGFDGEIVAIFSGSPDGLLSGDPSIKERTTLTRDEVPPFYLDELEAGEEFSSLDDAREYVDRIEEEAAQAAIDALDVVEVTPTVPDTEPSDTTGTTVEGDDGTTPPSDDDTPPTTEDDSGIGRG